MNPEPLQNSFRVAGQRFEFIVRIFRQRVFHQLDFFELVLADHAASVLAVTAGFGTKAGRISGPLHRQLRRVENLFTIVIGHRNFGGGDEIKAALVFKLEKVLFELGQLAGAEQ